MATYSPNLGITLPANGEFAGTWGSITNTNLGTLIEQAISGYESQTVSDAGDTVLTINNGSGAPGSNNTARNMYLVLTGGLTATRNVIVPTNNKLYFIYNATTGNQSVTVKCASQVGVTIPNGQKALLVCDGSDIVNAVTYFGTFSTGAINATPIGLTTPSTGAFTTLSATSVSATTFMGSGAALTGIDAANITTGLLPDARLTSAVAKYADVSANFTGNLQTNGISVGYKNIPVSTNSSGTLAASDVGKQLVITTGQTIPTGVFNAGDVIMIVNNSAASITITTSAVTAYVSGINTIRTPSVSLGTRGQATINFVAAGTCFISGAGVS
jgi:hypothetical protein